MVAIHNLIHLNSNNATLLQILCTFIYKTSYYLHYLWSMWWKINRIFSYLKRSRKKNNTLVLIGLKEISWWDGNEPINLNLLFYKWKVFLLTSKYIEIKDVINILICYCFMCFMYVETNCDWIAFNNNEHHKVIGADYKRRLLSRMLGVWSTLSFNQVASH